MADNRTVKKNPVCISGLPEAVQVPAGSSKTWKAGEFGCNASGLAQAIATDAVNVKYIFAKDQDTSTTSGDMVWVYRITSDMIFEGFISAENTHDIDAAATTAMIGEDYGLKVGSNYTTVETSETTAVAVTVLDIAANYSPLTDTVATSPGKVKFRFKDSVLTA